MPKKPAKKVVKFAQKVAPKLKKPKASTTPKAQKAVKKPPVAVKPVSHPMQPVISQETEAEKIWNEIRNLPIQMFGLPGQVVAMHTSPFPIEPSRLYLTIRSSATLPSLEVSVGDKFTVEQADRFVIVARKTSNIFPPVSK